jgi:hypothetical protein
MFAAALALSQVTTAPDAVNTRFDRDRDIPQVARLLSAGCVHIRKAFDIEDINLDDLIATAMDDPQAATDGNQAFRGIKFADLQTAYRQFCKGEKVDNPAVDLRIVIDLYNQAAADLPDHTRLKGMVLPGTSIVLDGRGQRFAELFEENQRRLWVPLQDIPEHVQKAFIAAEDKRFYQHRGIDERGLIRAFVGNLARSGRPQGGSTITQQIVKNMLVGDDLTFERKIREVIVAGRVPAQQRRNSRALPQLGVSRPRRLGHRDGGPGLFRKVGPCAQPRRRRAARWTDQGAELLQPRPAARAGARTAGLCAEPIARGRRHRLRAPRKGPARAPGPHPL